MAPVKRAVIFTSADLSTVQGSTEGYYVASGLAADYDLDIVSRHDPDIPSAEHRSIPAPTLIPAFVLYNFVLLPYFLYLCWKNRYDVIYTYKGFNIAPLLVATVTGAKWIADFRTKPIGQAKEWSRLSGGMGKLEWAYLSFLKFGYQLTLPRATAVIGLSEPLCDHLHEEFGVDREKLYLVPLGVDTDRFRPAERDSQPDEPLDVVYLGSISPLRGLKTCLSALSSSDLDVAVQLHLVGSGAAEYERRLRKRVESEGIGSSVTWHGYVDHDELPEVLSEMDAAVSPLPDHDSYEVSSPAKVYEYLAVGLPVVCTDIRAHRTTLTDGRTGFFYEPGSDESLVGTFNELAELDAAEWEQSRRSARKTAVENDWSVRLEEIRSIIEREET